MKPAFHQVFTSLLFSSISKNRAQNLKKIAFLTKSSRISLVDLIIFFFYCRRLKRKRTNNFSKNNLNAVWMTLQRCQKDIFASRYSPFDVTLPFSKKKQKTKNSSIFHTFETRLTNTLEIIESIFTLSTILAWWRRTFIIIHLALFPRKPVLTLTPEIGKFRITSTIIHAWIALTMVD